MTTLARKSFTCAVCQKESCYGIINSTNAFGSPDLDLRPPEMQRSTMPLWVQKCPNCGYTNYSVEEIPSPKVNLSWLRSEEYARCEGLSFVSNLARDFYHCYMVNKMTGDIEEALNAVVCAAWASDDAIDNQSAIACRLIAAELVMDLYIVSPDPELIIRRSDYLRRAGRFNEVIKFSKDVVIPESQQLLKALLAFECKHAEMQDAACYNVSYALEEMNYSMDR